MKVKVIEKISLRNLEYKCNQTHYSDELGGMNADMRIDFYYFDEDGNEVPVGHINIQRIASSMRKFNNRMLGSDYDTLTWMDDESLELSETAMIMQYSTTSISADMFASLSYGDLYYIYRIYIEKQFRGFGIGSYIMRRLYRIVQMCAHEESPILLLRAFPIEEKFMSEQWESSQKRLMAWYEKVGFHRIDDNADVMVRMR